MSCYSRNPVVRWLCSVGEELPRHVYVDPGGELTPKGNKSVLTTWARLRGRCGLTRDEVKVHESQL